MPLLTTLNAAKQMLGQTHAWTQIAPAGRIYFDALPPPSPGPTYSLEQIIAARPFALLWLDLSGGYQIDSGSAGVNCPNQQGKIICQIELNVPAEHANNPSALATWAYGLIGSLVRTGNPAQPGLWDLSRSPGCLPIRSIDVVAFSRTTTKEATDHGDAIIFELTLGWSTK